MVSDSKAGELVVEMAKEVETISQSYGVNLTMKAVVGSGKLYGGVCGIRVSIQVAYYNTRLYWRFCRQTVAADDHLLLRFDDRISSIISHVCILLTSI